MKSGFWGSSSAVTVIRRRILLICASTIFWISCVFDSRKASTVNVGRVSFFGGGGACGLVKLVCVALTSVSCFVYRPLPLLAGLSSLSFACAQAATGASTRSESAVAQIPFENRNWMLMISPLCLHGFHRISARASAPHHPRVLHHRPLHLR